MKFEKEKITGIILLEYDIEDLMDLGLSKSHAKITFLKIHEINRQYAGLKNKKTTSKTSTIQSSHNSADKSINSSSDFSSFVESKRSHKDGKKKRRSSSFHSSIASRKSSRSRTTHSTRKTRKSINSSAQDRALSTVTGTSYDDDIISKSQVISSNMSDSKPSTKSSNKSQRSQKQHKKKKRSFKPPSTIDESAVLTERTLKSLGSNKMKHYFNQTYPTQYDLQLQQIKTNCKQQNINPSNISNSSISSTYISDDIGTRSIKSRLNTISWNTSDDITNSSFYYKHFS